MKKSPEYIIALDTCVHKPEYVFLENVSNLKGHDEGNTWKVIHKELSKLYDVREEILSPVSAKLTGRKV